MSEAFNVAEEKPEEEELQNATVVVSGGGSTLLLKDRGASEELAEAAGKALEKCDFERVL